jgi:2-keto-4-pentenoate hydratase/2-oxohepta-3-ene-1,7-dioic acid hydratase in catechol pathway
MKLVRYGPPGKEKPGLIDGEGRLRDLSRKVKDIGPDALAPAKLKELARLDTNRLPLVKGRPRLGPCVTGVPKFIAIGLNYEDHAKESGNPIPEHPVVFYKAQTCIVGPNDNIMLPPESTHTDWEVELGVVVGRTARFVDAKDALRYVAGYCVVNDVSEREYQMKRSATQWSKGKGCDTFGPIGPWLVTADVITTGTPPGVGMGMKPEPQYLKDGDVVTLGITGLGEQRQKVVAFRKRGRAATGASAPATAQ